MGGMSVGLEHGFKTGDTLGNAVGTRPYKALTATTGLLDIIYRLGLQGWCVVGVL